MSNRSNEKTSNGIRIYEDKKINKWILMKEKHRNGCNILIMTFTNLEKYVYSKKCLKQQRRPPHPDWSQSKSRRRQDHSFPEGIISGRTQKWKWGLFYDFKILLVVVILAQVFLITQPIFIFKVCRSVTRSGKVPDRIQRWHGCSCL